MKQLALILLMTLVGTITQAMPWEDTKDFGDNLCQYTRQGKHANPADDSDEEACRKWIESERSFPQLNYFTVALRVCNDFNKMPIHRSRCYGEAAKQMREPDFRQDSVECDTGFFGGANDWGERAECQRNLFAKKAGRFDATADRMGVHSGFRVQQ